MQVSFGKFVPVVVRVNGRDAYGEDVNKVTNELCSLLRNDKGFKPQDINLVEQQRIFFQSHVSDYRRPSKKFHTGETPRANVRPLNLKNGRFLVTGRDADFTDSRGRIYNIDSNTFERSNYQAIQLGLTDEFTVYEQRKHSASKAREDALVDALQHNKLSKRLVVEADRICDSKKGERFEIKTLDLVG